MSTATSSTWDAKLYDEKHAFVWKFGADLIELLEPKKDERILDLGCGTGHLTKQIADREANVIGIDRSAEMIAKAKAEFPALSFQIADATDFRFDESFDAVFSNAVLHWVKPPQRAVECISRVLTTGGRFVAEFGGKRNVAEIEKAMAAATRDIGENFATSLWYYPGIVEYATLLENHGMEVTFATLFERPTPLDGPVGIQQWVRMFGQTFLSAMAQAKQEEFLERVAVHARPALFRDGKWIADYRRLRIVARKRA